MSEYPLMSQHLMYTLALLLTSTTVVAVRTLDSINDLKEIPFGVSVPKHSLLLLHWFANTIEIDNNDVIHLTFDPNGGDYGTHHYGNNERVLDPLPPGYRYYSIGNINARSSSLRLPNYVTRENYNLMDYEERNRDRIIVRVREYDRTIDQVYITQHYELDQDQGTRYDPQHTYRITNDLLTEIRLFSTTSTGGNLRRSLREVRDDFGSSATDAKLRDLENMGEELAFVGLLLFIVIKEKQTQKRRTQRNSRAIAKSDSVALDIPDGMQYEWPQARENNSSQDTSECMCCMVCLAVVALVVIIICLSFGNRG